MIDCIGVENMRLSDQMTIATTTTSLELMQRAAYGVFKAANWSGRTAIVVGSGNNGGDGFALACILHSHNIPCAVFTVSSQFSADSTFYAEEARTLNIPVVPFYTGCLKDYDIIVDCLLGTGFQGELRPKYIIPIEEINASDAYVISVDINSGMNGDSGVSSVAVVSDLTVTIGYTKRGLISPKAARYIRQLVCTDIGIRLAYEEDHICSEDEWFLLCRQHNLNPGHFKYTINGTVYHRCPSYLNMHIIPSYDIP